MKAITPQQAIKGKRKRIPADIIEIVNKLIVINMESRTSSVAQEEIIKAALKKGYTREGLFDKGYLDIEDTFRAAGWHVTYDKPAYNETYPATFTFRPKSKMTLRMTDATA